jgi:hypothetical protein
MEEAAKGYGLRKNEVPNNETGNNNRWVIKKLKIETKIYNFEKVNHFEYLGITVFCNNEEELDIDRRMSKELSREISRKARIRIQRTVVKPMVVN